MRILIVKLGATGDVARTSTLLRRINGEILWLTTAKNRAVVEGVAENLRCVSWEEREVLGAQKYDLIINLEDSLEVGHFLKSLSSAQWFGAYLDSQDVLRYTDDSRRWFDLSLISVYGREKADLLKLQNRRTYQDLIFEGLGFEFTNEPYALPKGIETGLSGDVALATEAGPVWPMKKWAFYDALKEKLEMAGLTVNVLPHRSSLLEHLWDVRSHRCLVGGDSLPMHFALGTGTPCVTLFTCTSPWEIHDYGIQTKIVSPLLEKFFYKRGFDKSATTAIGLSDVYDEALKKLTLQA